MQVESVLGQAGSALNPIRTNVDSEYITESTEYLLGLQSGISIYVLISLLRRYQWKEMCFRVFDCRYRNEDLILVCAAKIECGKQQSLWAIWSPFVVRLERCVIQDQICTLPRIITNVRLLLIAPMMEIALACRTGLWKDMGIFIPGFNHIVLS